MSGRSSRTKPVNNLPPPVVLSGAALEDYLMHSYNEQDYHFRVYVDENNGLRTDSGDFIREATGDEIEEGKATTEGFIIVPEDVKDLLDIDPADGTTHLEPAKGDR